MGGREGALEGRYVVRAFGLSLSFYLSLSLSLIHILRIRTLRLRWARLGSAATNAFTVSRLPIDAATINAVYPFSFWVVRGGEEGWRIGGGRGRAIS